MRPGTLGLTLFLFYYTSVSLRFILFVDTAFLLTPSPTLLEGVIGRSNRNSDPDVVVELWDFVILTLLFGRFSQNAGRASLIDPNRSPNAKSR
jgi:hypothetical protein